MEVDRDTAERMGRIQASYRGNREAVLGELLRRVCDIQPEFHANYRVAGWVGVGRGGANVLVGGVSRENMDVSDVVFENSRNLFSSVCQLFVTESNSKVWNSLLFWKVQSSWLPVLCYK